MITFIVAPSSAPQTNPLTQAGIRHPLAGEVLNSMRQHGSAPVSLWKLINKLAAAQQRDHRARDRCWRLRYWGAIRELCRAKLLFRHRGLIATRDFAFKPKPRPPKMVSLSVGSLNNKMTGSIVGEPAAKNSANLKQPVGTDLVSSNTAATARASKTQSAPGPAQITQAARSLALLPRNQQRKPTGWIGRKRAFRDMVIRLPNGKQAWVFGALRQQIIFTLDKGQLLGTLTPDQRWGVLPASAVEIVRNPHAALLGRLKGGTIERKSEAKARAARLNGLRPCRPGKRRGRPACVPNKLPDP